MCESDVFCSQAMPVGPDVVEMSGVNAIEAEVAIFISSIGKISAFLFNKSLQH